MTTHETPTLLRPESLRTQVERFMREAIANGRFKPGERLVEREICEMLNISRPSLREAFRVLEAEKLIHIIPNKGPVVARMSMEEARDLYTIRALLESFAAQQFALLASDEAVDALGVAVKDLRRIAKNDRSQLVAAKSRLYDIIHEGCGSPLVASILQGLLTRINLLRATSLADPRRLSRSLEEIDAIYAAIRARNAALARELAEQHIVNAQRAALAILEKQLAG